MKYKEYTIHKYPNGYEARVSTEPDEKGKYCAWISTEFDRDFDVDADGLDELTLKRLLERIQSLPHPSREGE